MENQPDIDPSQDGPESGEQNLFAFENWQAELLISGAAIVG